MICKYIKPLCFLIVLVSAVGSDSLWAQMPEQEPAEVPLEIEQQLENLTENEDDMETEDDSYFQLLHQFIKEPVNLNYADKGLLQQLNLLSPIQIDNLIAYRKLLGNFLSIYELQAVPAWDVQVIKKLRPYITVEENVALLNSINSRLKNGDHTVLIRTSQILEKSKGYWLDSSTAKNFYPGSPNKLLVRYKYTFKNSAAIWRYSRKRCR